MWCSSHDLCSVAAYLWGKQSLTSSEYTHYSDYSMFTYRFLAHWVHRLSPCQLQLCWLPSQWEGVSIVWPRFYLGLSGPVLQLNLRATSAEVRVQLKFERLSFGFPACFRSVVFLLPILSCCFFFFSGKCRCASMMAVC